MGDVIEVDFVQRKRKKDLEEIYEEANQEILRLSELIHYGHGDPVPNDYLMPLPDDGLDHD